MISQFLSLASVDFSGLGLEEALFAASGAVAVGAVLLLLLRWDRRRGTAAGIPPVATWTSGLAKTRGTLAERLFGAWRALGDADTWLAEVEEILLSSDVGVEATAELLAGLRGKLSGVTDEDGLRELLKEAVREILIDDQT